MILTLPLIISCQGEQSTLNTAGSEAEDIAHLIVVTAAAGAIVWVCVVGLMLFAAARRGEPMAEQSAGLVIAWGGVVLPASLLFILLAYVLFSMPATRPWFEKSRADVEIEITGEQYWWRVRYLDERGNVLFENANEIRLPAGRKVRLLLRAHDVIHSFWLPSLAGKMDMIPGRTNILWLEPERVGIYRGPCTEFCGTSHTRMSMQALVLEPQAFASWVEEVSSARKSPADARAHGQEAFLQHGCGACHAIDGTAARGRLGPNLTRLFERDRIGAGASANDPSGRMAFVRNAGAIKPGALMPAFPEINESDLRAISDYLGAAR
ncbi:cytochrome c oxidase subunit 2 [Ensifer adhaerens]|uniref:cytochrome c oxidase subunit II n=1 Tax=Ensifer adhaerens TaxID=106592 RepID=UPI00156A0211|nr:cytochrome c oxidase subunit II [Ensifer adhaerens]NRP21878.1 cytochrome c oxidase subunit 2 [Ensifer adhaerens]